MPRFDPIMTAQLRWLIWKLRLKGWLLRRYWPHTYAAINSPIWAEGGHHVYHDFGHGFLVLGGHGHTVQFDDFADVVTYVRGS